MIFYVFQVIPGDPVLSRLGQEADPALEALLREELGLDQPPMRRYLNWVVALSRGDLGTSIRFRLPVQELIGQRLPNTLALAIWSFVLIVVISIPLGIWLARHSRSTGGLLVNAITQLGIAIPSFWLAIMLMLVFGVKLGWLPINGYVPWRVSPLGFIRSMLLPGLAISFSSIAIVVRYLRASLLDQMLQDYVRTARNKGLSENVILFRHVLRNAFLPVLTILGVILVNILTGSIVIESTFSIPGLGQLLQTAIRNRDLPLVQGITLYISVVVTLGFLFVDLLSAKIDPRIRDKEEES
jgi:peptide/nickel transport system permease protein